MDSESAMFHAAIAEATVQSTVHPHYLQWELLMSSEDMVRWHPKCGQSPQASGCVRAVLDTLYGQLYGHRGKCRWSGLETGVV